jgi:GDPmannose 4,6-dehydratase
MLQVREFVELAFAHVGIHIMWEGEPGSVDEIGLDANNPEHVLVKVDPQYFRPTEVR